MQVGSGRLFRALRLGPSGRVAITEQGIEIASRAGVQRVPVEELGRVTQSHGLIWSKLRVGFRAPEHGTVCIGGLPRRATMSLRASIVERQLATRVANAASALEQLRSDDRYLNWRRWSDWEVTHQGLLEYVPDDLNQLPVSSSFRQKLTEVLDWLRDGQRQREERNRRWVEAELERHHHFFDSIEGRCLSASQRRAIVSDEDNTLVVAGAGTGKTSTLVGKVAYLLQKRMAKPDEILLLTFTRSVCEEMKERVRKACGSEVEAVHTFHSLGNQILGKAWGKMPNLAPWATENKDGLDGLHEMIQDYLQERSSDQHPDPALRELLVRYRYPERDEHEFRNLGEYRKHLKSHCIRTLRGEAVKSHGELVVADFLTAHGVRYEYEGKYEKDTATKDRRQYRPDFRLLDYPGVYIEYFGVDRNGRTAPWVDEKKYVADMVWKIGTHRDNRTTLIALRYYNFKEGNLEEILARELREARIELREVPLPDLIAQRDEREAKSQESPLNPIVNLLASFLNLYRANNWTLCDLSDRLPASGTDRRRAEVFLDVFRGFLTRYEEKLEKNGEIDFSDMITKATSVICSGGWTCPFRYVLVDEFQDMSRGRAGLLKALLEKIPDRRLFCVGDDWQSIFRFAGNDVSIMAFFASEFGCPAASLRRVDLAETYRLSPKAVDLSSKFIQRNPQQLTKTLIASGANRDDHFPTVSILYEELYGEHAGSIREVFDECLRRIKDKEETVAVGPQAGRPELRVLGRYHHVLSDVTTDSNRSTKMAKHTVHKAKGLEADYVIVLDVTSGRYGFPTEISDDPLLGLVLSASEEYPNAEERRLFYVALTRARKHTYLVTSAKDRSSFIAELESAEYDGLVNTDYPRLVEAGKVLDRVSCPDCGGTVTRVTGKNEPFWGCENYPYCRGESLRMQALSEGCGR